MAEELSAHPLAEGGGVQSAPARYKSAAELFDAVAPAYIAMGMTPAEFWDGDAEWAKHYREAQGIKNERLDHELWLQGVYIYRALIDVSPLLNAFAPQGTKARDYLERPLGAFQAGEREQSEEVQAQEGMERLREKAMDRFRRINAGFGQDDG